MNRRTTFLTLLLVSSLFLPAIAGLHLGFPSAVKNTVKKLKAEKNKSNAAGSSVSPVIYNPQAIPPVILASSATAVTITAFITNAGISSNITLLRLNGAGNILSETQMYDDGLGPDQTAGDKIYTRQANITEFIDDAVNYQVQVDTITSNLTIPVVQVVYPQNNTEFNLMSNTLVSSCLNLQTLFQSLNSNINAHTIGSNELEQIATVSGDAFAKFEGVTNQDVWGIFNLQKKVKKAIDIREIFVNNPYDPRANQIRELIILNGWLEECHDASGTAYLSSMCPTPASKSELRLFARDMQANGTLNPTGEIVQAFGEAQHIAVKGAGSFATTLLGQGFSELFTSLGLGTVQTIFNLAKNAYNVIDYFFDSEGNQNILIGETTNNEIFEVPSGTHNTVISYKDEDTKTIIENITIPAQQTTPVNYLAGQISVPNAPTALSLAVVSDTAIRLSWLDNSGVESGFKVERSTDGASFTEITVTTQNVRGYNDTTAAPITHYYYKVRAYNTAGNSGYSNTAEITTSGNHPPVITSLTASLASISTGAVTTITCSASDPDGDALAYAVLAASGTLSGPMENPVSWTAPESGGIYTISCSVSDGKGGSDQSSANVIVTAAGSGGDWVLVPGNPSFGTSDFYVMKYEAKNVGGVATSQADVSPWVSINHPSAVAACAALGSGAHLLTIPEVQTINRNIEAQADNWADGIIGSLVSAGGGLKRGNVGITDSVSYTGADWEYGIGRNTKAKLVLSNGSELWDWSGNVSEWVYGAGGAGTLGTPSGVTFNNSVGEWSNVALNEERPILGPSNNSWDRGNGMGWYRGGESTNAVVRGGYWPDHATAGVFAFDANYAPLLWSDTTIGFRCAVDASTHQLPDTGQEQSYTATFGEDHDYQPITSQPSYTDNGNGTTTDNKTGLMWVKDGNSAGCNNGGSLTWEAALNFCEGLTYAGYSDWRLPNVRELESIVDAGQGNPAINTAYFPNTQDWYWTSTTYVPNAFNAWDVGFSYGSVGSGNEGDYRYVRCVRAGP